MKRIFLNCIDYSKQTIWYRHSGKLVFCVMIFKSYSWIVESEKRPLALMSPLSKLRMKMTRKIDFISYFTFLSFFHSAVIPAIENFGHYKKMLYYCIAVIEMQRIGADRKTLRSLLSIIKSGLQARKLFRWNLIFWISRLEIEEAIR